MKIRYGIIVVLSILTTFLSADNRLSSKTMGDYNRGKSNFEKHGFMIAYAPTNKGFSAKVYGIPQSTEFKPTLSYFSFYVERKGTFSGGEFDDPVLDFWEKEDKDIYRKYIINLGSTQALISSNKLVLSYFAGIGLYEEFQQYRSIYGNDWFINNKNKVIGDVGIEMIGRFSVINLGLGVSYQSLYYFSAGFEF